MPITANHEFSIWRPVAVLRVSGGDALNFLQGQFTNELRNPVANEAVYGLWLNQKGKVVADSFIAPAEGGEAFWVVSYFSPAAVIRERLEAFIIADDVVVEDATAAWTAAAIFGAVERKALTAVVPGSFAFGGRRGGAGVEWLFPTATTVAAMSWLAGGRELSEAEVAMRRIRAGVPAVPEDIGPGELPNEGGLEATAISYTKGCYLGQEVMARLKAMGQVRRGLRRVSGRGQAPVAGTVLFQGERKVGELRSVAADGDGFVGLALLTWLNLDPAAGLATAAGGAATITIEAQP